MTFLAALPALLGAAGPAAGAAVGAAAAGAGVSSALAVGTGISGLGVLGGLNISTILGGTGALISGIGGVQSALYAKRVAEENAKRAAESAKIESDRGQIAQQDADYLARIALGAQLVEQAASGFDISSPSLLGARKRNEIVARTNAERIRADSALTVRNLLTGAADSLSTANQARSAALFSGFSTLLNFGSTALTEGTTTSRRKLQSLRIV